MLALIVERPTHGYELAHRLNRRLGPTWYVEPRQIYPYLDELTRAGLVTSTTETSPDRPRQSRVVYHATDAAHAALQRWMQSDVERVPVRPDVMARVASAMPENADKLLRALGDYEAELLRLLEATDDADLPVRSWSTLMLAIGRDHTDAYLRGEFQWLDTSRRRIREFLATSDD